MRLVLRVTLLDLDAPMGQQVQHVAQLNCDRPGALDMPLTPIRQGWQLFEGYDLHLRVRSTREGYSLGAPTAQTGDGGVLEGTNRTTSGVIGQP